jgi:hypothetical protein
MRSLVTNRQVHLDSHLRGALFAVVGILALLVFGAGTAMAEEEGSSGPIDPIVVPEIEVPQVTNPTTTPAEPSSGSGSSASAPATKAPETVTSTGGSTQHTSSPASSGGSGGSKTAPTQVNHSITGSGGSGGGNSTSGDGGGGGGSETTSSAPTGSSPSFTTTNPERSLEDSENATTATAAGLGAGKKKPQPQPTSKPDKAPEAGQIGAADAVTQPDKHAPFWAPLGGKNSLPYKIVIIGIVILGLAILFLQFTNPQRLRYWRARLFGMPEASIPVRPKKGLATGARPRRLRTAERSTQPSSLSARRAQRRKAA